MTQNQNAGAHGHQESPDPPEGLEIVELVASQKFRIRELASWSTKVVGALFLAIGIAFLMVPIMQDSLVEDFLKGRSESIPPLVPQLVRVVLIAAVVCLLFQIMRLLFGTTEVQGTSNTISSCKKLFGIPLTRSMDRSQCQSVELKYYRGRKDSDSGGGGHLPGNWKLSLIGRSGSLTFYRTGSMEQAKWLSRFVANWLGVEVEQKRDKRRIGW